MPKILIVDDEAHIRLLLEQTLEELEDEGIEILSAINGEDALKIINDKNPELVFLDVMMPKLNGFEVCNEIKNNKKIENIYIALLTAKGQEFDKQKGKEVGADLYLTKPFNPDEVVKLAKSVLKID